MHIPQIFFWEGSEVLANVAESQNSHGDGCERQLRCRFHQQRRSCKPGETGLPLPVIRRLFPPSFCATRKPARTNLFALLCALVVSGNFALLRFPAEHLLGGAGSERLRLRPG